MIIENIPNLSEVINKVFKSANSTYETLNNTYNQERTLAPASEAVQMGSLSQPKLETFSKSPSLMPDSVIMPNLNLKNERDLSPEFKLDIPEQIPNINNNPNLNISKLTKSNDMGTISTSNDENQRTSIKM